MKPGEVHLSRFPFGGRVGVKARPVLLLSDLVGPVPEILVAYMSTVIPATLMPTDLILDPGLPEYASTNLKARSILRLRKIATIHDTDVLRHLGELSPTVWNVVQAKLRSFLNL